MNISSFMSPDTIAECVGVPPELYRRLWDIADNLENRGLYKGYEFSDFWIESKEWEHMLTKSERDELNRIIAEEEEDMNERYSDTI